METIVQTILQILPGGNWLLENPFGTVYGTYLLNVLSCILLPISKLVFKTYFLSSTRKKLFLGFVAGTSLIISAYFVYLSVRMIPYYFIFEPSVNFEYLLPIFHGLSLIAYLFFLGYFVDFVISLVRRRGKEKKPLAE